MKNLIKTILVSVGAVTLGYAAYKGYEQYQEKNWFKEKENKGWRV